MNLDGFIIFGIEPSLENRNFEANATPHVP